MKSSSLRNLAVGLGVASLVATATLSGTVGIVLAVAGVLSGIRSFETWVAEDGVE